MTNPLNTERLLAWYDANQRDLPWRRSSDPYRVWLSEVMLQQTQVATVIPYYERFLADFPSPTALADADEDAVLKMWEGLGYYNRCHNLLKAMRTVRDTYHGEVPSDPAVFLSLSGVGAYTCAAVQSIAFGHTIAAVDGNVNRVVTRLLALDGVVTTAGVRRSIQGAVDEAISADRPGDFNQAMMELGATVCTPRSPNCGICPFRDGCRANALGQQESFPVKAKRPRVPTHDVALAAVLDGKGQMLIQKRPPSGHLAGLWEFPGGKVLEGETHGEALHRTLGDELGVVPVVGQAVGSVTHAYSHFKVVLHLYLARIGEGTPDSDVSIKGQPLAWLAPDAFQTLAFPTANRKLFPLLLDTLT